MSDCSFYGAPPSVLPSNPSIAPSGKTRTARGRTMSRRTRLLGSQYSKIQKEKAPDWYRQGRRSRLAEWRKGEPPKVNFGTKDGLPLLVSGRKAESLVEELKGRLPDIPGKEVWLEQLSALLQVAEDDYGSLYEAIVKNVKLRLKLAKSDLRKKISLFLWGFVNDSDLRPGDWAREIANLTEFVLCRMAYAVQDSIYKDHLIALSSIQSLEEATDALSNSTKVTVGNVSMRTFITEKEAKEATASTSIASTNEVGE